MAKQGENQKPRPTRRSREPNRNTKRLIRREVRHAAIIELIRIGRNVLNNFIKWGAFVAIAWAFAWAWAKTAPDLAGRETKVNVALGVLFEIFSTEWWKWVAIVLVVIFLLAAWIRERTLRKKVIARLADDKSELERLLDSKRTSSGMKPHGAAPDD